MRHRHFDTFDFAAKDQKIAKNDLVAKLSMCITTSKSKLCYLGEVAWLREEKWPMLPRVYPCSAVMQASGMGSYGDIKSQGLATRGYK